ncbi:MAG: 2-amino-4-hydroxy-6-hydroxymethyldihydropteridine diphosphokinase [Clostridia bacterium]|nr:2-amino-4-hydroxy-6-hydroxymethyldihydropteridine diphosphokinase [Clostridia bacterium]
MQIEIKSLRVDACHGCHAEEKINEQPFVFTVRMDVDYSGTDELTGTVSYSDVMKRITAFVKGHCFNLIEYLADEVAKDILVAFPKVKRVAVRVEKPQAPVPLPFETVACETVRAWQRAHVAMGSNLGDRKATLDGAIAYLKEKDVRVKKVSSYLASAPYGGVADREFLNGAMEVETFLSPEELLRLLNECEARFGRERKEHWGNRTLDLDLLLYGNEIRETPFLTLPHPELHKRDFVLVPLKEIAPYAFVPTLGKKVCDLT